MPSSPAADTATVLYVHSAASEVAFARELELVVAAFGSRMGILLARGSESECALATDLHAERCWPQPGDDSSSQRIWEHWDKVQWQVEALLPEGTHPRLAVGFAEGAVFVARAFKRGALHVTMAAAVGPAELEPGEYPDGLVGLGVAADSVRASAGAVMCPRPGGQPLAAADLALVTELFNGTVHPPADAGLVPGGPATCILHASRPEGS